MADPIEFLLQNKPIEQWTPEELKAGFVAALYKLNQADKLICEQEKLIQLLQTLSNKYKQDSEVMMATVVSLARLPKAPATTADTSNKRKRGRPPKEAKADLSAICDWYIDARNKYGYELSDTDLIKEFFSDLFEEYGMGRYRVDNIKSKLSTFRTEYVTPAKGILQAKGLLRK